MTTVAQEGGNKLPQICAHAPGDIRHYLHHLYWLARMTHKIGKIVELGVREGDSTRALLAACQDVGASLWSYDIENAGPVVPQKTAQYGIPWFDGVPWFFLQQDSVKAAQDWPHGAVDLVFVDTDHSYETTRAEISAWHRHVRPGGAMAFHDYCLRDAGRDGVGPAVEEFANRWAPEWRLEFFSSNYEGGTGFCVLYRRGNG